MRTNPRYSAPSRTQQGEGCVILFLLFVLVVFICTVVRGMVTAHLWQWFVSDTFGILRISVVQAIGLAEVLNLLVVHSHNDTNNSRSPDPISALGAAMFGSLLISGAGMLIGLIVVQYV